MSDHMSLYRAGEQDWGRGSACWCLFGFLSMARQMLDIWLVRMKGTKHFMGGKLKIGVKLDTWIVAKGHSV